MVKKGYKIMDRSKQSKRSRVLPLIGILAAMVPVSMAGTTCWEITFGNSTIFPDLTCVYGCTDNFSDLIGTTSGGCSQPVSVGGPVTTSCFVGTLVVRNGVLVCDGTGGMTIHTASKKIICQEYCPIPFPE